MPEIRDDVVTINGRRYVPEPTYDTSEGARRIAMERADQMTLRGWTAEHDDEHTKAELAAAAVCYLIGTPRLQEIPWPWDLDAWKPESDPVRNLVKAGALIAAEIDRLLRKRLTDMDGRLEDMGV